MAKLKITQVRSKIKSRHNQRETLRTLGLGKIGKSTIREDRPEVRGQIRVVEHLVKVESAEDAEGGSQ
jgi:large subunit ribosomal protein L30